MDTKPDLAAVLEAYGVNVSYKDGWSACKCVIHNDSHASAAYNLDKQVYHCLVCNVLGDVYDLVKNKENLKDFNDVKRRAKELANGRGAKVLHRQKPGDTRLPGIKRNNSRSGGYVPSWKRKRA